MVVFAVISLHHGFMATDAEEVPNFPPASKLVN
jgi:hypothetical protein